MNCHLNVEICSSVKSIKYVLKYVHKGSDQATFNVSPNAEQDQPGQQMSDEIRNFVNARYISSTEALWRIFHMPIHERFPPVFQLAVHLENGQRVYFNENNVQERANQAPPSTTLTAFFSLCETDAFAKTLFYSEVPAYYTWNATTKKWTCRQRGNNVNGRVMVPAVGRIYTISPRQGECFFLRMLLHHVKGPESFIELRTVNGTICQSYREACLLRGLLQDDNAHHMALEEAAVSQLPHQLRNLFSIIIVHCEPSNPLQLWQRHKDSMCEDFVHAHDISREEASQHALLAIEAKIMLLSGKSMAHYGLPETDRSAVERMDFDYRREVNYDMLELKRMSESNIAKLNNDQKNIHHVIVNAALTSKGGLFFLDAPGGCGKTFLMQTILATIRSRKKIAIATASSGLAATLLPGGMTIHKTFKVPLNISSSDNPYCSIKKGTSLARLITDCSAIIIDEAPMSNKVIFEALDRTLQDIRNNTSTMGGITTLMCGDFRQILPVVRNGTRANIINACLKKSVLWHKVKVLKMHTNMRVLLFGDQDAQKFSDELLQIGNGLYQPEVRPDKISINQFGTVVRSMEDLIESVYPAFNNHYENTEWLSERAILAPFNEDVLKLNREIMKMMPGESKLYLSQDSMLTDEESVHYPTEFLNSIESSGMPAHKLELKIGMPVMLMRSLNPPQLMNGTRCVITKLSTNAVFIAIASGPYSGEHHVIPRISLQPSDTTLPFIFVRKQFPIQPCFAVSINKSQGQTFKTLGIFLQKPVFSHGMLYVALSRSGSRTSNFILAPEGTTRNVVYPEVFK